MAVAEVRTDTEVAALAQRVADEVLAPRAAACDAAGALPPENLRELGRTGLLGLLVPARYGGLGGTVGQYARVAEILARACPSTGMTWVMHTSQYVALVEHGSERQRAAYLPAIADGSLLVASATTEPGTGGNFFYCNSAARRSGAGWLLTSTKPVVTAARHAGLCFAITRADPEASGDHLSLFMVPCDAPGVSVFGSWDTVGMRATESLGLQLTDVALSDLHLLGEEGRYGPIALSSTLPVGLCGFAAVWLGAAQAAFHLAVEQARRRGHRFSVAGDEAGHAVSAYESVQRQVGEASLLLQQARAFIQSVAASADEAKPARDRPIPLGRALPIVEAALAARVAAGESALTVTTTALRIAGAQGYRRAALEIERYHRDVLSAQVMAPAPDMIKTILGRLQLGESFGEAVRFR
jgi:alkylation response protein AidB-like acyl-CoA dehydrogenase